MWDSLLLIFVAFIMRYFVMNSIGMFGKFMNIYDLFMNSFGYNHKRFIKNYGYIMNKKIIL